MADIMHARALILLSKYDNPSEGLARVMGIDDPICAYGVVLEYNGQPYASEAGGTLLKYWNTKKKIEKLFKMGKIGWLGQKIGSAHNMNEAFEAGRPTNCSFFARDLPGTSCQTNIFFFAVPRFRQMDRAMNRYNGQPLDAMLQMAFESSVEWIYLFTGAEWIYTPTKCTTPKRKNYEIRWKPLTDLLEVPKEEPW